MAGKSKSERRQRKERVRTRDKWLDRAVDVWKLEQDKPKPLSLEKICAQVEKEYFTETGQTIKLSSSTLDRRVKGGQSHQQAGEKFAWLTKGQTKEVVTYIQESAARGFPLSHRRIKEHVDEIARATWGEKFPEKGVGKAWTDRFVSDHYDEIQAHWSRPLDNARARAVNPATKAVFFDMLGKVIEGEGGNDVIPTELIFGADETGIQEVTGQKEKVFGKKGKRTVHQERTGSRENITVLVTICADGEALKPAVIFKGSGFLTKWKQDNPTNASMAFSKKGYMTQEHGLEYIKDFDEQTKAKANGRRRLLLVDGHNSHYSREVLEYARQNRIELVCYPSHSTHIFQGLDVVIFSPLKKNWTEARDDWERAGKRVTKMNFLEVYARAHFKTLTNDNIKTAFRVTGIVPFNPDVITSEMMAPAAESSSAGILPVSQHPTIVHIAEMISDYVSSQAAALSVQDAAQEVLPDGTNSHLQDPHSATPFVIRSAVDQLFRVPSSAFLTASGPIHSSHELPIYAPFPISPAKPERYEELTNQVPQTEREWRLQTALIEAAARDEGRKDAMKEMQASVVLTTLYTKRVRGQLEDSEVRKRRKKEGNRLIGDGHAKWFSGDAFYNLCVAEDERRKGDQAEKATKADQRASHSAALADWNAKNDAIRKRNEPRKLAFQDAMAVWTAEKRPAREKPKMKDFGLEKLLEKPKRPVADDGGVLDEQPVASGSGGSEEGTVRDLQSVVLGGGSGSERSDSENSILGSDEENSDEEMGGGSEEEDMEDDE